MIIDSHQHVMLPVELQIKKMDEAGVDQAILFTTGPHPEGKNSVQEIREEIESLYRTLHGNGNKSNNEDYYRNGILQLVEQITKAPDRFYGFGSMPIGLSKKEAQQWIETYIVKNHLLGIGEFTPGNEQQVSGLEPVFEAAADYVNLPLWIHTFYPMNMQTVTTLMELCKKYPNVPVIFGHMGGVNWMDVIEYAKENPQIYLDLSAAYASIATKTAIYELPERCLFSSDAPYGETYLYRQLIEYVSPNQDICQKVLGGNIKELLDI